ncbi:16520_t:CDS:2 [Dentiscutata erythropus]|uniref:16520_t:CDS:1 n=1 Tax=Dentiscutata erythropus TaxID=1348616 RepID=A0A9N9CJ28_9GLOM|nr:16520_t:CDS:2 [Dentiscutata erythropus]
MHFKLQTIYENVDTVNNIQDQLQTNSNNLNLLCPVNRNFMLAINDDEIPMLRDYHDKMVHQMEVKKTILEDGAVVKEAGEVKEEDSVEKMCKVFNDDNSVDKNMADIVASNEEYYHILNRNRKINVTIFQYWTMVKI